LRILLGDTARQLRESLGLTQRAAAHALGISFVHLCNIERNRATPSPALIDKFRDLWGVDLYVLAWCTNADTAKLPAPLRKAASDLADGWHRQIDKAVRQRRATGE
jgi:transcriptional regulator with XRE-family HTH domain